MLFNDDNDFDSVYAGRQHCNDEDIHSRLEAFMKDLGIPVAIGPQTTNPLEISATFPGPLPDEATLTAAANKNGLDAYTREQFDGGHIGTEWAAVFRMIEARDPEVIEACKAFLRAEVAFLRTMERGRDVFLAMPFHDPLVSTGSGLWVEKPAPAENRTSNK